MKFSIENIRTTPAGTKESHVERSHIEKQVEENLSRFCYEVLISEQEIGYGNFSFVYEDTNNSGICYKKFKPNAEKQMRNTAAQEMKFMEKVYGLDDEVKTPLPMGLAEVVIRNNESGALFLNKIIAMEQFKNSTRLEDVIEPKNQELKKDFPESFDLENFFSKLENFTEKMHSELSIYHGDLFSRNILIDNETGNPIVIDFGDAAFPPADDNYDAYGRRKILDQDYEDKDIKNIQTMKQDAQRYIDSIK